MLATVCMRSRVGEYLPAHWSDTDHYSNIPQFLVVQFKYKSCLLFAVILQDTAVLHSYSSLAMAFKRILAALTVAVVLNVAEGPTIFLFVLFVQR